MRTSYDPSIHLRKNKETGVSQTEYAKIIGSVMFLMKFTRPDIAYAVSIGMLFFVCLSILEVLLIAVCTLTSFLLC